MEERTMRSRRSSASGPHHSFKAWLASDGTPANAFGASWATNDRRPRLTCTRTLDRNFDQRVYDAFADYPLTDDPEDNNSDADDDAGNEV
jgi:hypothetical protein